MSQLNTEVDYLLSTIITDEKLNQILLTTNDFRILKAALTIKYNKGQQLNSKLYYTIEQLLELLLYSKNSDDFHILINILEMILFLKPDDDLDYCIILNELYNQLLNYNENNFSVIFELMRIVLKSTNNEKRIIKFNNSIAHETVKRLTENALNKSDSAHLNVIQNYLEVIEDKQVACQHIWEVIKAQNYINALCVLEKNYISNINEKYVNISEYWLFIQENINSSSHTKQKLALYLLRNSIDFIIKTNFQNAVGLMQDGFVEFAESQLALNNFCLLLEISREKQLHLIEPAFPLLDTIQNLHPSWLLCLYKIFLKHSQTKVICYTLKTLFQQNWYFTNNELFKSTIKCILIAINKSHQFEETTTLFDSFQVFYVHLNENLKLYLLELLTEINWVPCVLWFLYKNSIAINKNHNIISIINELFTTTLKLPNKTIKIGCIKLLIECLQKQKNILKFEQWINILLLLNSDENLNYALEEIVFEQLNVDIYIAENMQSCINVDKLRIMLKLRINYTQSLNETLINHFKTLTDKDERKIAYLSHICKILYKENKYVQIIELIYENIHCIISASDIQELIEIIKKIRCIPGHENIDIINKFTDYCSEILLMNKPDVNINQIGFALAVYNIFEVTNKYELLFSTWLKNFMEITQKYDSFTCQYFCKMFFEPQLNLHVQDVENATLVVIRNLFDTQDVQFYNILINYLPTIRLYLKTEKLFNNCLNMFFNYIKNAKRTCSFNVTLKNFINTIFDLLQSHLNNPKEIVNLIYKFVTFSESYGHVENLLSFALQSYFLNYPLEIQKLLCPLLINLLLSSNSVLKKCDRLEYEASKDVLYLYKELFMAHILFNWKYDIKIILIDIIMKLTKSQHQEEIIEAIIQNLLEKHSTSNKKRYFPNSLLHFQKLRILQFLLILDPSENQKDIILKFVLNYIQIECTQNCIRQLLQFLLIRLSKNCDNRSTEILKNLIENQQNMTVQTTLVPVLYHISIGMDEQFVLMACNYLCKLTMGPQFSLRLYTQVALLKIYEFVSKTEKFKTVRVNFAAIYNTIKEVLNETKTKIRGSLDKNQFIFDILDPVQHYSLETIFVNIPQLNGIDNSEWEISKKFIKAEVCNKYPIKLQNDDNQIKDFISNILKSQDDVPTTDDSLIFSANLQKKIQTWKLSEDTESQDKMGKLIVVTSLIKNAANIGGLTRTSEIFNVQQLVVHDKHIVTDNDYKNLSMSSEGWVNLFEVKEKDLRDYLLSMKSEGYCIIGLEQTENSIQLNGYVFQKKSIILLGNEKCGINASLLPILDVCIEIPQFGLTRSLNVHVAGAIVIWEYTKQFLVQNKLK